MALAPSFLGSRFRIVSGLVLILYVPLILSAKAAYFFICYDYPSLHLWIGSDARRASSFVRVSAASWASEGVRRPKDVVGRVPVICSLVIEAKVIGRRSARLRRSLARSLRARQKNPVRRLYGRRELLTANRRSEILRVADTMRGLPDDPSFGGLFLLRRSPCCKFGEGRVPRRNPSLPAVEVVLPECLQMRFHPVGEGNAVGSLGFSARNCKRKSAFAGTLNQCIAPMFIRERCRLCPMSRGRCRKAIKEPLKALV